MFQIDSLYWEVMNRREDDGFRIALQNVSATIAGDTGGKVISFSGLTGEDAKIANGDSKPKPSEPEMQ